MRDTAKSNERQENPEKRKWLLFVRTSRRNYFLMLFVSFLVASSISIFKYKFSDVGFVWTLYSSIVIFFLAYRVLEYKLTKRVVSLGFQYKSEHKAKTYFKLYAILLILLILSSILLVWSGTKVKENLDESRDLQLYLQDVDTGKPANGWIFRDETMLGNVVDGRTYISRLNIPPVIAFMGTEKNYTYLDKMSINSSNLNKDNIYWGVVEHIAIQIYVEGAITKNLTLYLDNLPLDEVKHDIAFIPRGKVKPGVLSMHFQLNNSDYTYHLNLTSEDINKGMLIYDIPLTALNQGDAL